MPGIQVTSQIDTATGRERAQESTAGAGHVTTAGGPKAAITPTIKRNAGATTSSGSSVTINSGASAGSQHIQASADTEADVLQELVRFEFDAGDKVTVVYLGLSVAPAPTSEVQDLKFVVNGDVVADATRLFTETGISWVFRNEMVEIGQGGSFITSISCLATTSGAV